MGSCATVPGVALVCSAGGLDAVSRVLGPLPPEFAAAVIVLRHQSPHAVDRLASILRRRTALRVTTAGDGSRLTAGRVLIAPPGHHTLVTGDGTIALVESGERPPYRPSADLLLTTLALALGPRAVAVVLSGYGNDGATGASVVHRCGGLVIASDEATSEVFGMPSAAINRDKIVDRVLALGDIPAVLLSHVRVMTASS